jgi:hypothetical protein
MPRRAGTKRRCLPTSERKKIESESERGGGWTETIGAETVHTASRTGWRLEKADHQGTRSLRKHSLATVTCHPRSVNRSTPYIQHGG